MAKKKNDDGAVFLLAIIAFIAFLPFLFFSVLKYRKLKKKYTAIPNVQRVYDTGVIYKTIAAALAILALSAVIFLGINSVIVKNMPPEFSSVSGKFFIIVFPIVMLWPMKKMAERVAVEYFGVIFNDNDRSLLLPYDIQNMSFGDQLRLRFISRLGDQERIEINKITNLTREKGINFYIHGDFGSRKINFTNKQKRDECIAALQVRSRTKSGRDYGY